MARQIISLSVMLLHVVAASLVIVELPPLASSAVMPPKPIKSYFTPERAEKILDQIFGRKPGPDDVIEKLKPPPEPPSADVGHLYRALAKGAGVYTANLAVGTPAQTIPGVLDISTQFVWMHCDPCTACRPPPVSTFKPRNSGSFSLFGCSSKICQAVLSPSCAGGGDDDGCKYVTTYGNDTATAGYLAADTFTIGTRPAAEDMVFGCSHKSDGDYSGVFGVIGFSRGPLSLVSQLSLSNFSYVLQDSDRDIQIELGDVAVPQSGLSRTTRLLRSSKRSDDLYYVALTGIKVGGKDLSNDIPAGTFDLRDDGSGGVFLSTTVAVTYLHEDAYDVVRKAFVSKMMPSKPVESPKLGHDLCYTAESMAGVDVPRLTLVFDGADAEMELRPANYLVKVKDGATELQCLAVLPSPDASSLLGSLMQTGTKMIYDLRGERLTFVKEEDSTPPPSQAAQHAASMIIIVVVTVAVWMLLF